MNIAPVDPRDADVEAPAPTYWVIFWQKGRQPEGLPGDVAVAFTSDEFRITDARDVHEVITWADSDPRGRQYSLYCELLRPDSLGNAVIARLAGEDPNAGDQTSTFEVGKSD